MTKKLNYKEYKKLSFKDRVTYHICVDNFRPLSEKEKIVSENFNAFLEECKRRYENNERII